jgi:transcriptional regulator with XRE-family HTH domain
LLFWEFFATFRIAAHELLNWNKEANMFLVAQNTIQELAMTDSLLKQLKKRRLKLGLKQKDMMMRIGVSRQQYQRLESKGNPRLDTLELIAKGLNNELMLIPKEKVRAVIAVLESAEPDLVSGQKPSKQAMDNKRKILSDDPWQNILEDDL